MQTITTIAELDKQLDLAAEAAKRSGDDFYRVLQDVVLDPRVLIDDRSADPFGSAYHDQQMKLYELVADKPYVTQNESTPFDHEQMMRWPFPYATRNASQVGDYLMTYGNLIKTMDLRHGARILEVGSGYGPLTWHLASMGHHVTCVDVHEPLLHYVRKRTAGLPGRVDTIVADMNELRINGSFDAVIFFESFHHGARHVDVLKSIPRLLEPNGILVLAGEPIVPKGSLAVPYPWGLRMDGVSLWYIRKLGWMELGFEQAYIRELFERLGWSVVYKPNNALPLMDVWIARRRENDSVYSNPSNLSPVANWTGSDPGLHTQVGMRAKNPEEIHSNGESGYLVYGPYAALDSGFYEVQWVGQLLGKSATGNVDIVCKGGQEILGATEFQLAAGFGNGNPTVLAHLRFRIDSHTPGIEFRLRIDSDSLVAFRNIVLRKY